MKTNKKQRSYTFTCDHCKKKKNVFDIAVKWICNDCYDMLEQKYYESIPAEDQPLDDDIPDYMDEHQEDFENYLKDKWCLEIEEE